MIPIVNPFRFDIDNVPVDPCWNTGCETEMKMHRIHAYPAKFPAFITTKALQFAQTENVYVSHIADIFCGCGTSAFEAKRAGIDFWGCDISQVATLIAYVKSQTYQSWRLKYYQECIQDAYSSTLTPYCYESANERLRYWYDEKHYNELDHLKSAILYATPRHGKYRCFFLCAFSNILKSTSCWLTKSIKPQVDPNKKPSDVLTAFTEQCRFMMAANDDIGVLGNAQSIIVTGNFLDDKVTPPMVDMVVSSPPYVTSYEYADLHQLSSLWLDFAQDYRDLRKGTIGSLHHDYNFCKEWRNLNKTGTQIVWRLLDQHKAKARSVAKYFLDMQKAAVKVHSMLNNNGLVVFVIGNTEYKGVRIDNARHLAESLLDAGFHRVNITKRKISKKILTPYRDERGKFSTDSSGRKVYSEEFILVGRK